MVKKKNVVPDVALSSASPSAEKLEELAPGHVRLYDVNGEVSYLFKFTGQLDPMIVNFITPNQQEPLSEEELATLSEIDQFLSDCYSHFQVVALRQNIQRWRKQIAELKNRK